MGMGEQDIGRSCNTFHSCTHNYARMLVGRGERSAQSWTGNPCFRGLSEVWHSKIEKPKFKLGQLFEFMTKWHTHTHGGIRMGMHAKTVKDQPGYRRRWGLVFQPLFWGGDCVTPRNGMRNGHILYGGTAEQHWASPYVCMNGKYIWLKVDKLPQIH